MNKRVKEKIQEITVYVGILLFTVVIVFLAWTGERLEKERAKDTEAAVEYIPLTQEDTTVEEIDIVANTEEVVTDTEDILEGAYETDVTDEDVYNVFILAHIIDAEAGINSHKAKMYVGSVVLNRVASKYYPDTIEGVIFQHGQYSPTWNGTFYNEPYSEDSWEVARELYYNGSILPADVLYQAEFKQGSGVYEQVDGMYFCYY